MVKPQSPHRIVYKKEKKPKAPNTKAAQVRILFFQNDEDWCNLERLRSENCPSHSRLHQRLSWKKKIFKIEFQARKSKKKIAQDDDQTYNGGARITDFFEIRRSSRKPAKQIEEEQRAQWKQYLKEERIDG